MTSEAGLSLFFPAGCRPAGEDIARLVDASVTATSAFSISHRPEGDAGWMELLANGLTFDVSGLAPAVSAPTPALAHSYGFEARPHTNGFEAITLRPGLHLAGAGNLMPVVRSMVDLAMALSALPDVGAIVWHPARTMMAPAYFGQVVGKWLEGGPFPALGLTALAREVDGGIRSEGLAFFTGQELRIEPTGDTNPAQAAKIAVRLINNLVTIPPVVSPCELTGPGGERLNAEPSANGRFVRIWRQSSITSA